MIGRLQRSPFGPWAGMYLGALAWVGDHQLGSDLNFWRCNVGNAPAVVILGLAFGLLAALGGWLSWTSRGAGEGEASARTFAAWVGAGAAGIFILAIALQTGSALVPECHR
jgi:hypothetical protein